MAATSRTMRFSSSLGYPSLTEWPHPNAASPASGRSTCCLSVLPVNKTDNEKPRLENGIIVYWESDKSHMTIRRRHYRLLALTLDIQQRRTPSRDRASNASYHRHLLVCLRIVEAIVLETLDSAFCLYEEIEAAGLIWFCPEAARTNRRLESSEIAFHLIRVCR